MGVYFYLYLIVDLVHVIQKRRKLVSKAVRRHPTLSRVGGPVEESRNNAESVFQGLEVPNRITG